MLNENLKQLRKSKGLSQEELAIRLNVVRQTISKCERYLHKFFRHNWEKPFIYTLSQFCLTFN